MANVEERVLEMKLDSSDLERNAESSIKTIQKLNQAMQFDEATKGFADLDKSIKKTSFDPLNKSIKSIDFNPLNAALQESSRYLVSFGATIKRTFFEEISKPLVQFPMQVANFVVKPFKLLNQAFSTIQSKGWTRATNIDQAKFQLEGLGLEGEKFDAVWKGIQGSVKGTAYGLDEAAKVASQFYATGIEDGELMESYLRGVAGTAAMTNAEFGDIGHIFTTVAGQGKLMSQQLNQLASKGLNVAATLGEQLGKSEADIRQMVSKGQISFDMFASAMDAAFGKHAKDANKTFEGSLSNMKAALGRIGADFATPIRVMAIPVFNRLTDIFDNIKAKLNDNGIYEGFTRLTENIDKVFTKIFGEPGSENFGFLKWMDPLVSKVGQVIDFINNAIETVFGFVSPVTEAGKEASEVAETITKSVEDIEAMAKRVINLEFGSGEERRKQLEELGYSYEVVQNRVNELLGCSYRYEVTEEEMAAATEKNAEAQKKQATFMGKVSETQSKLQETAKGVVEQTKEYVKAIDKKSAFQKLQKALAGIGSLFSILGNTVGSLVKGAWQGLLEAFTTIGGWILNAAAALGEWITKLEEWLKKNKVFETMQNGINKAVTKFNGALKTVGKVGKTAFDVVKAGGSKVGAALSQAKENAKGFMEEFKQTSAYQRISDIIEKIKQKFIELKDAGIQKVLDLIERFKGTKVELPSFDAGSFAESVSNKINWILDKFATIKESIKGIFSGAKGAGGGTNIATSIKGFFESETFQNGLSTVTDLLGRAKDAILEFFGIFADNASTQISNTGDAIGNFATAAKGFGGDLIQGGKAKLDEFIAWLKEMSPTFKEVGKWIQIAISNFTAFKAIKSFWNLLDWAKKGGEVLDSVKGTVDSVKGVIESFGGIFRTVSTSISTLTTSLTEIGTAYKKNLKASALLKTAIAVGIFAAAMWALGQLSWEQLSVAAAGIGIITVAIAALIGVLGASGAFGKGGLGSKGGYADQIGEFLMGIKDSLNKFLKKAGSAMMIGAFVAAIAVLTHCLKSIGDMKWESIAKGVAGIFGIMMVLMAAMAIMAAINKMMWEGGFSIKQMLMLITIAGAVMLLGMAVKRLGKLSKSQLTKGLVAVTVIAFVLGAMMELSKNTKEAKAGPIVAMTFAIAAIAGAVLLLSLLPTDKLAAVTTVMAVLMGVFALMMAAAGQMKGGGAGMIAGIVLMGLVLGEIAAILYLFTKDDSLDPDRMLKISGSMAIMMVAFGAITKLCQYIGSSGVSGVIAAATGALEIAGITGLIFLLAEIIGQFTSDIFTEEQISEAENGIHLIGRIFTALSDELGNVVGAFFGGLFSGSLNSMTKDLPEIGNRLSQFVTNLGSLAGDDGPSFKGFTDLLGFIGDLTDMAGDNTTNDILTSWFFDEDSSIIRLGEQLNTFAGQMQTYAGTIKGLDEDTVTSTSAAIQTVMDYAAAAPETGGLFDMLTGGDSSLSTFGKEAYTFALWMVKYSEEISGMSWGSVMMTSAAINTVMQYANATPNIHTGDNSLLGKVIGDNSLQALAEGLVPFAKAMVVYSKVVALLDAGAVEKSESSVKILEELASNIPNIADKDTFMGWFKGENTWEALGTGLADFGQAMVDYAKVVGGDKLDTAAIENSQTAAGIITALAASAPSIHDAETFMGWLTGDNSLATLGTNITEFGEEMVKFANTVGGIENMDEVEAMLDRVQDMLTLFGQFSDELVNYNADNAELAVGNLTGDIEGIFEYFSTMWGDENLTEDIKNGGKTLWERFVEGIDEAAKAAGSEGGGLAGVLAGFASSGAEGEDSSLKAAGESMATQLIGGFTQIFQTDTQFSGVDIPAFVLNACEAMNNAFAILGPPTVTPGMQTVMRALGNAITSYGSTAQTKIRSVCNQMKTAIKEYVDDFETLGKDLVKGLAKGMTDNATLAKVAAQKVVNDAIRAGKAAADSNSPSKKTMELGEFMTEGLAIGMTNKLYLATASAAKVSSSVIDSMEQSFGDINEAAENAGTEILNNLSNVYAYIGAVIENAMDVDPRITPVMDLSNIQNGVSSINSMLGGSTYGLGGLAYARSMYPGTYTNPALNAIGTGNDMFSVVQGIRTDLNTLGQAMSNMQMVMDSGALVGSISGGVDKELGSYQKLKERWA